MRKVLTLIVLSPLLLGQNCLETTNPPPTSQPAAGSPRVRLATSRGDIVVELFDKQAPIAVANFLAYVNSAYYDDVIVHEVSPAVGIRLGRYRADLVAKNTRDPIANESNNGLGNRRGYLAMIERSGKDSATSEFIIYTADQASFNFVPASGDTEATFGRTVFGRVVQGMSVVDAIANLPTESQSAQDGATLASLPTDTVTLTARELDANGQPIEPTGDDDGARPPDGAELTKVRVRTSFGDFVIQLDAASAPQTVENFLQYVDDGYYDGTIFHRVVANFVIQTGGFLADGTQRETRDAIPNEPGRSNLRGTVAMAKVADQPNSATSQWFVNVVDNTSLDTTNGGFTVFGEVVEGMSVVDDIAAVEVDFDDRPVEDVNLIAVERMDESTSPPTFTTASGLMYQDLAVGTGDSPDPDATVTVNYTGTLTDDTEFDSGQGSSFNLGGVIAGFSEGIQSMKVGGTRRLTIPPDLGYGDNPPSGSDIPPGATLIFEVELLSFE